MVDKELYCVVLSESCICFEVISAKECCLEASKWMMLQAADCHLEVLVAFFCLYYL